MPMPNCIDNSIHSSDMVLVRMGADDDIELADPLIFERGHQAAGRAIGAGVDQHITAIDLNQDGISLTDIQKINRKSVGTAVSGFCDGRN